MILAYLFFALQIALAVVTVAVVGRLFMSIKRCGQKHQAFPLLLAGIVAALLLSAYGLFAAATSMQAEIPPVIAAGDWLLGLAVALSLTVFSAYGKAAVRSVELEQSLRELSTSDSLTGALNKQAFLTMAGPLVQTSQRFKHPLSALVVDIDHFARLNDDHGRSAGDEALRAFGAAVSACLRKIDLMGRLGGEKFAIILPHTDIKGATVVAERVCMAVQRNVKLTFDKKPVRLTASVGVAVLADGSLDDLINTADGVMYSAKRNGRNQVAIENVAAV